MDSHRSSASARTSRSSARVSPEPRLAWALVEVAHSTPDSHWPGGVLDRTEAAVLAGDRLLAPRPGETGSAYRLTSLSAYARLRPAHRPQAFCPVCRERVWMKLGPRNRHHYAHVVEHTACAAATAEGALHLAAKLHLATVLERVEGLRIARLCHRSPNDLAHPCRAAERVDWVEGWDEVRVEHAIPSIRADLMLLREGRPVGAIEVCATHAVDAEKSARYRKLGIPWIEVPASRITDLWRPLWEGDGPLPVLADSGAEPWRCRRHAALFAAWTELERNGVHRLAGRYVHVYRTDGGISASELRAERISIGAWERREAGKIVEAWLVREDTEAPLGAPVRCGDRDEAMRALHGRFGGWVRWTRAERGALVDSPMRWAPAPALPQRDLDTLFPERARWDPHTSTFILPPNAPSLAWPVVGGDGGLAGLTGAEECFWTALPERDRPPQMHALVGPVWATLQVDRWLEDGTGQSRGLLHLYRHDGRAWCVWGTPPFVLPPPPIGDWATSFPALVRALAGQYPSDPPEVEAAWNSES